MAIPSGSGTEVLKRTTIHSQANTETAFRWDGTMATTGTATYTVPALHIITVLSVIICDQWGTESTVEMDINDGANDIYLLQSQTIGPFETFVWNDRFVLIGGDKLLVNCGVAGNLDFLVSYIDQDWT